MLRLLSPRRPRGVAGHREGRGQGRLDRVRGSGWKQVPHQVRQGAFVLHPHRGAGAPQIISRPNTQASRALLACGGAAALLTPPPENTRVHSKVLAVQLSCAMLNPLAANKSRSSIGEEEETQQRSCQGVLRVRQRAAPSSCFCFCCCSTKCTVPWHRPSEAQRRCLRQKRVKKGWPPSPPATCDVVGLGGVAAPRCRLPPRQALRRDATATAAKGTARARGARAAQWRKALWGWPGELLACCAVRCEHAHSRRQAPHLRQRS